jgi:hypothetical protein
MEKIKIKKCYCDKMKKWNALQIFWGMEIPKCGYCYQKKHYNDCEHCSKEEAEQMCAVCKFEEK